MLLLVCLAALALDPTLARAGETRYAKDDHPSTMLVLRDDGRGEIVDEAGGEILVEGRTVIDEGGLRIDAEGQSICPAVNVVLSGKTATVSFATKDESVERTCPATSIEGGFRRGTRP